MPKKKLTKSEIITTEINEKTKKSPSKISKDKVDKLVGDALGETNSTGMFDEAITPEILNAQIAGQDIFYMKLKTGEELVSFIHKPGSYIEQLMLDAAQEKDPIKRKIVMEVLEHEKKSLEEVGPDMMELHFPTRLGYMPTPKGPALVLQPWVTAAISPQQVFRISVNDVLTMIEPDDGLKEYYISSVHKLMLHIGLRMQALGKFTPGVAVGKAMEELQEAIKEEEENESDEQMADVLAKVNKPTIEPKQVTSSGNTIPFVVVEGEKKTLH